jgi:ATP-binding cassette, subfamily B, multidrug efflux pump
MVSLVQSGRNACMKAADLIKPYLSAYRRPIALGLLALITVDLLQLMIPRVIKWAVDDLAALRADAASLARQAVLIVALAVLIGLFRYVWRRSLLGMSRRIEESLRNRLHAHLQTLSADYFDRTATGDLMAHATNDINQVRMAAGMGLVAFNDAVVLGAAAIGFMLYIHVQLTLYVLIPMPLIVIGTRFLGRRMHQRYQTVQAAFSDLTEMVRERIAGIRMIKAHAGEAESAHSVGAASQQYVDENIRLVGVTSVFFPMMMLLTNLSLAIVLWLGGRRAILAEITPGDFVAFISYLNLLTWPMMALGWVTNLIQRGGASLERLKRILEQQPTVRNRPAPRALPHTRGEIVFDDVVFRYATAERPVLTQVRLNVVQGQVLGIVGPPGSGKSTLLSLIPRLYEVNEGRITLDGYDIRDLVLSDLRSKIAYVPQEPFLFAGTIRDNLTFACAGECDEGRLKQVISDVALSATLAELPAGIDTVVGERGVLLSGGQKQRIALGRALLLDAPILLLDDPISQVDTETGRHIVEAIGRMVGRKTILIVSHRLAAIRLADRIASLEQGRVVETGTHAQLIAGQGYYARVHALQELEDAL